MSAATEVELKVWNEWNKLPDSERSPVKTIASKLGMNNADVAAVVYSPETFGAWNDDQEPNGGRILGSFDHNAIEENATLEEIREAVRKQMLEIRELVADDWYVDDWSDKGAMSAILSNLNNAKMHLSDPYGC